MKKVELLSPAKNLDIGIAAINSGADAIYIGASDFGARVNASNSPETVEQLVNYAHKFYVKVYVTINTILNNLELERAVEMVKKLYNIGVDAIIIQDFGLLEMAAQGKLAPIPIHISTQCNNRILDKVKFFDSIGVSRVITARELSLNVIKEICRNTNCEIETFIHGALCVSYSGQCYFSYANGGRSANRGECAQPCRKKYSLVDETGKVILSNQYLLSLKDFNASEYIENLIDCGVNSFKIEGRLKDANYVKNVVLYYNNLLSNFAERTSSGKVFADFQPDINKTFNRLYTDYFLNTRSKCYNFLTPKSMGEYIGKVTKVNKTYITIKSDKKLNSQDGICYAKNNRLFGFKINKIQGMNVYPNVMPEIVAGTDLYRNFDSKYDKILQVSAPIRKIGVKFIIYDDRIVAEDEDFNKITELIPSCIKSEKPEEVRNSYIKQLNKTGESEFYVIDIVVKSNILPFMPICQINELRRNMLQKLMKERLMNYKHSPQKPIGYANYFENSVDFRANVFNDKAKEFYQKSNCNVCEFALESGLEIPSGIELMRCKHCLKFAANLCSKTTKFNKKLFLVDENGKKYPLKFDCKNCEMIVLST